jgi:hypothetical protein
MWTYEQAWQRLTSAYTNNQVEPYDACGCFVGNLLNRNGDWVFSSDPDYYCYIALGKIALSNCEGFYTIGEIVELEACFMNVIYEGEEQDRYFLATENPSYEDYLFRAFETALEHLRQIHQRRGEVVESRILSRRQLAAG